jgi:hypothetical protein
LAAHPDSDVAVHVIWAPVLGGDIDRARQATATVSGPNVDHYWDPDTITGQWARDHLPWPVDNVPAWDVFYLFDRDATWADEPEPVATGYTIVGHRDALAAGLEQLLGNGS